MSTDYQQAPVGLRVGDYEILGRLGEGGMGVVHLARRPDGHRVALKVLRPHIVGDDEARDRLAREVNSLGRIRSRWIAEIVDADPWGPVPYVATRYVPGLSLHDHVRDEGPVDDVAWFAARLADGLAAVHDVGVLHRDIKPSNVLMEGRAPILIDFGLARVADDPKLTHTGWLLGTPGYLAPEILYGDDATEASDLHSWAATVAFAGTGHAPFGRGPSAAIMDRVRRGQHRLSGLDIRVRELVASALQPDPAERPTLDEVRSHLAVAAPTTVLPPPDDSLPEHTAVRPALVVPVGRQPLGQPIDLGWFDDEAEPTRLYTELVDEESLGDLTDGSEVHVPAPRPRPPLALRFRRGILTLALWGVVTAGIALAPYLALAALVGVVWLLRAGSLAGSAHLDRRARRGARWYDGLVTPLSYPWFFAVAIPGLLMLGFWSGGLAVAAGLVAYAFAAPIAALLLATGAVLLGSMWWGPGGSRLRGPVRRLVWPLAAHPVVWVLATAGLVLLAGTGAMAALNSGVDWLPAGGGPLAANSPIRDLINR
jgi:hypothetical protein